MGDAAVTVAVAGAADAATSPTFAATSVVVSSRRGDNAMALLVPAPTFGDWRGLFILAIMHWLMISRVRCGEEGSELPDVGAGGGANDGDVAARVRAIAAIGASDVRGSWCDLGIAVDFSERR